jgi:hypothetical protein
MPEGPEVETEKLHEAIHEKLEQEGGALLRTIAVSTALLAALAAIASLRAGATVNEALLAKTDATKLQAQASDQWAYYQAKGVKAAVAEGAGAAFEAAGRAAPAAYAERQHKYAAEQDEIKSEAGRLEKERDAREEEASHLLHAHERYSVAVALFQVSIALGAVAALTRMRLIWVGSALLGLAGLVAFVLGWMG